MEGPSTSSSHHDVTTSEDDDDRNDDDSETMEKVSGSSNSGKKYIKDAPQWKKKLAKELLARKKKKFPRRRIFSPGPNAIWAADLLDITKYKKENKGNTFILVVVDLFSKKAWARPLLRKTGPLTAQALSDILVKSKVKNLSKIWSDDGKEFRNVNVERLLNSKNITLYSTHNDPKSAIAERFIRTLRGKMETYFILSNSTVWLDALPHLITEYNKTKHRSIGMSPDDAQKPENFELVYKRLYGKPRQDLLNLPESARVPAFQVGDRVRISLKKRTFEKESTATFSEEIYEISEVVQSTQPITYKIADLMGEPVEGKFYKEQLQKTDQTIYRVDRILRKRKGKSGKAEVLVQWMGYPSKFNSWEEADTILRNDNVR